MPRSRRLDYPGAWHHVMNRGARREAVFTSPDHCNLFLTLLEHVVSRFGIQVHAYVLMPNHFHLLVRSVRGNLSRCMQQLLGRYTQALNEKHGWDGPVFRGRFKNQVVSESKHLQILVPYIHLNPVRAGLVPAPHMAIWSSYPDYLDARRKPDWLTTDLVLSLFGGAENLATETVARQRGELQWPLDFDLARGEFKTWSPDIPRSRAEKEQWAEEQTAQVREVFRRVTELEWDAVQVGRRGRLGNPARRFAIWLCLMQTGLDHAAIACAVGATVEQVTAQIFRMRHGPIEPPLSTWMDRARTWLKELPPEPDAGLKEGDEKANT
jgi:REP element-mobilizing transposase RayT